MASPKLMASYFTVAGNVMPMTGDVISPHPLAARAAAAVSAGYVGMGLITADLMHNVRLHGYDGIRHILDDHGVQYLEFEALVDWFAEGERRAASDADRRFLLEAAEKLGAWHIKIAGDVTGTEWPLERMVDSFAELCAEAADSGTQISLEIFPDSNVRDLPTAMAIVGGAGASNGGLLLDIWHFARGGIPYEDIATIPRQYIKHVELDDADATIVGTIMEDTLCRRRLPGEGALDVPRFIECIRRTGYDGLYGVEILSDAHRALPIEEAASLSAAATLRQFE